MKKRILIFPLMKINKYVFLIKIAVTFKKYSVNFTKDKLIKSLIGHTDAVTSVCTLPSKPNLLISGSHDGSIRTWDIRKY